MQISPLQMNSYVLRSLEFRTLRGAPADRPIVQGVDAQPSIHPHKDDPLKFMIEMTVTGGSPELKESTAYFRMVVEGFFEVLDGWPADQVDKLVRFNAPAVLWGTCRELLLSLSFRSETGPVLLPCVNFLDPESVTPPKTPAKPPRKPATGRRKKSNPG
jgi:preprotein translocase subunit SecB